MVTQLREVSMSDQRTSSKGLSRFHKQLSARDLEIIRRVSELRLVSTRQIEALYFSGEDHASALSAARSCRRVLVGLTRDRLLVRLDRRVGGVRAGSASYIYAIGPVGHRVLEAGGNRPRFREPTTNFVAHTLAVTQVVVDVTLASRQGAFEILSCQSEPRCWREFSGLGGRMFLRPDLFLALGVGEWEQRWLIEIDRGSEHLPALLRKCRLYDAHYRSGKEQAVHGLHPQVCWIMPDEKRAARLQAAIAHDLRLTKALFVTTTFEQGLLTLSGGSS